jgi:hypothetical protein
LQIAGAVGAGGDHLQQQALGVLAAAHLGVSLSQARQALDRTRPNCQPTLKRVGRCLVLTA